jgi:peptidylprolyl isomerase/peptidyl-prolyl cis-trans isomerase B (cyclophilin B)
MLRSYSSEPAISIDQTASYAAVMATNLGELRFDLAPSKAPKAVNNFVFLAREGFYDNTDFYRLVPSFVAQGGSPDGSGTAHPGYLIEGELPEKGEVAYPPGALALAEHRLPDAPADPPRQGCQFFVALTSLDGLIQPRSPVLGLLSGSLDVIAKLNQIEAKEEAPTERVVVERITIEEA